MASAELSRRVEKVVGYPPLSELGHLQRREFHKALLEAGSFEDFCRGSGRRQSLGLSRTGRTCGSYSRRVVFRRAACCRYLPPVVDKGKLAVRRGRKARGLEAR